MRTVAIIQARLASTRFPRKILADLDGKPVLQHVYERVCQIPGVNDVLVIVPWNDYEEIQRAVPDVPVLAWKGVAESDVLERYRRSAEGYDAAMRITSDCPVLDPVVAGQVLDLFHASQPCDFASNDTLISGYPDGWDVEVFSRAALETAAAQAVDPADKEHVTPWMKRNLKCVVLCAPGERLWPKLSVDSVEDLERIRRIIKLQSDQNIDLMGAVDEDARRAAIVRSTHRVAWELTNGEAGRQGRRGGAGVTMAT